LKRECVVSAVTKQELTRFTKRQEIDPAFASFAKYARHAEMPLIIVSDGLDFYIQAILDRHGLGWIPFYANRAVFRGGHLRPEFPYYEFGCGSCGNCKRYHVESARAEADRLAFVGDGLSDRCAVNFADLVFAKGDLSEYCRDEGIPFIPFETFADVARHCRKTLTG
jgi:2,3-diketo-5-methylthio-1-phosphopentane phosphatase